MSDAAPDQTANPRGRHVFIAGMGIAISAATILVPLSLFAIAIGVAMITGLALHVESPQPDAGELTPALAGLCLSLTLLVEAAIVYASRRGKYEPTFRKLAVVLFATGLIVAGIALFGPTASQALGRAGVLLIGGIGKLACAIFIIGIIVFAWRVVRAALSFARTSQFRAGLIAAAGVLLPSAATAILAVGFSISLSAIFVVLLDKLGADAIARALEAPPISSLPPPPQQQLGDQVPWNEDEESATPEIETFAITASARPSPFGSSASQPSVARCIQVLYEPVTPPPPRSKVAQAIRALAFQAGRARAEGAAHSALLAVCMKKPELADNPKRLGGYFWRSAQNRMKKHHRDPIPKACNIDDHPLACPRDSPESLSLTAEYDRLAHYALCKLSAEQQEILRLRFEEELSFAEIGEAIGRSKTEAHRQFNEALEAAGEIVRARCKEI